MKEQERNIKAWCDLQEVLNRGEFDKMDAYFHTDFVYDNRDGKIIRITSVADVLLQLIQLGVIDRSAIPIQPNR
jgi:hypothetical protein